MISQRGKFIKVVSVSLSLTMFSMATPATLWKDVTDLVISLRPKARPIAESRLLTETEMGSLSGRTTGDRNQYIAGASKWSINYRGVDLVTGNFSFSETDLSYEGGYGIPVAITRTYSANNPDDGPFGVGWTLSVDLRTTAGGVLKGSGSPSRSVPVRVSEVPLGVTQPGYPKGILSGGLEWNTEGVVTEDGAGQQTIIQRDVDGILSAPAWDKNKIQVVYDKRMVNGEVVNFTDNVTITTPEGTVYYYDEFGYNDHPTVSGPPGESSVMKISTVTDRHGNTTTYTYDISAYVEYSRWTGNVHEYRLSSISMPGGRGFTFDWNGTKYLHEVEATTNFDHKVTYTYSGGKLATVTKAVDYVTEYTYADVTGTTVGNFLHTIEDPRDLVTTIVYDEGTTYTPPMDEGDGYSLAGLDGIVVKKITYPNGHELLFRNCFEAGADTTDFPSWVNFPNIKRRSVVALVANNEEIKRLYVDGDLHLETLHIDLLAPFENAISDVQQNVYDVYSQDLLFSRQHIYDRLENHGLDYDRRLDPESFNTDSGLAVTFKTEIETETSYNYFGLPLSVETTNIIDYVGQSDPDDIENLTEYAYWEADKFYQQKAIKAPDGTISFTDYFTSGASAGKGQVKEVYDDKHTTFINTSGTDWRDNISPQTNPTSTPSAEFTYDDEGRPLTVEKLGPTGTVTTKTTYSDAQGTYGNATMVQEDFGGINRTTETLTFDTVGRAIEVEDAAGCVIETHYDAAGNVEEVEKTSGTPQTLATYVYGPSGITKGLLTSAEDGISGRQQVITYYGAGAYVGLVQSITENDLTVDPEFLYSVSYEYNAANDRVETTYVTPNGTTQYTYGDYISVGGAEDKRVFRTMTAILDQEVQTEQFHYAYDSAGRLVQAAFMQSPTLDGQTPLPYETDPAATRAQAYYQYNQLGQIGELYTIFGTYHYTNEDYDYANVVRQKYFYTSNTGRREKTEFYEPSGGSWAVQREETYGYDLLGQLTTYDADGSGGGSATTWTYDGAGNRSTSGYTYDKLNRMTASPGSTTYQNDILGNRTWKNFGLSTVQRYVWDEMGRLNSLCGTTVGARYHYRVDGLRVKKVEGLTIEWIDDDSSESEEESSGHYDENWAVNKPTTRYYYDGHMGFEDDYTVQGIGSNNNITVTRYAIGARGIDGLETKTTGQNAVAVYPVYDGHGNMVATLARNGSSFTRQHNRVFDAWGNVTSGSGGDQGYVANLGHRKDTESGLTYMRARYYEPSTGRFISEDPARDGINWAAYCRNDPVNLVDFSGNMPADDIREFERIVADLYKSGLITQEYYDRFLNKSTGVRERIHRMISKKKFSPEDIARIVVKDCDTRTAARNARFGGVGIGITTLDAAFHQDPFFVMELLMEIFSYGQL